MAPDSDKAHLPVDDDPGGRLRSVQVALEMHADRDWDAEDVLDYIRDTLQGYRLDHHSALIPTHVLRDRYDAPSMSPMQAIAYYLCDDPAGPELTQQAAGDALGMSRGQVYTHLSRARRKLREGTD